VFPSSSFALDWISSSCSLDFPSRLLPAQVSRSQVDRTVLTRYYAFLVISQVSVLPSSNLISSFLFPFRFVPDPFFPCSLRSTNQFFVFSLISVVMNLVGNIIIEVQGKKSIGTILAGLNGEISLSLPLYLSRPPVSSSLTIGRFLSFRATYFLQIFPTISKGLTSLSRPTGCSSFRESPPSKNPSSRASS